MEKFIGEYFFDEFIAIIPGSQTVAMVNEVLFGEKFPFDRVFVNADSEFCREIILQPKVVIARKVMNGNARICDFCQLTQDSHESFGHHSFVFKPEVKQIPQEENFLCLGAYHFEPLEKMFLSFPASFWVRNAEMEVGGEKYFLFRVQDSAGGLGPSPATPVEGFSSAPFTSEAGVASSDLVSSSGSC